MPLISLVSAKGSPGVTTTAAALVAVAHSPDVPRSGGLLVELDPAGGDLDVLAGARSGASSLLGAAADVRRDVPPEELADHVVEVVPGVRGLLAPTAAHVVGPVIESVGGQVGGELAAASGWVVSDAGRWDPGQSTAGRLSGSEVVVVVCRSTAVSVAHSRDLVAALRPVAPTVAVMLVGDAPYGPGEVAEVIDVPVLGPVAWDPRGVSGLWASGASRRWLARTGLGGSARSVLADLEVLVDDGRADRGRYRSLAEQIEEVQR